MKRARAAEAAPIEDEFARFFAVSLDLLCVAGADGYFRRLNPAWTRELGWTEEELRVRPFLDFVHPDDRDATMRELAKLADGVATILFENRYRHRDGSYRWLQWNACPEPKGGRIYCIARDVTSQKRLERQILDISDREKERLGRELHDGLCQNLAGIAALSATLSRKLAASSEAAAASVAAEISTLLKESIAQARDLARGLGPAVLDEADLDAALETLARDVEHRFRVSCTFQCDGPFPRLCREAAGHLFRIAQEAVNNAVTHGRAARIEIRLRPLPDRGLLSIRDDGVGLPRQVRYGSGIGMRSMAYRARIIRGALEVRRRVRRGTAVTCTFPLPFTVTSESGEIGSHVVNGR